jgi:hypothetical protein
MLAGHIGHCRGCDYQEEGDHAKESGEVHGNSLFEKTSCTSPGRSKSRSEKERRGLSLIIGKVIENCQEKEAEKAERGVQLVLGWKKAALIQPRERGCGSASTQVKDDTRMKDEEKEEG